MSEILTIVVVPRDRFSSAAACVESILKYTDVPFRLVLLDFGYPAPLLDRLRNLCTRVPFEIVACGRTIPMTAFREYLPKITTRYTAWVDNDTYVTEGWIVAALDRAAQGARVILPVTWEREGLDIDKRGIRVRNHISHSELRKVSVAGKEYVFDQKPYRRCSPDELPQDVHTVDFFELHAFFAETEVLRMLDLPPMVVREHIDIGIQLHRLGIDIWCDPKCQVEFDNIHERPDRADLGFFFYRWDQKLVDESHDLFEQRWGYRFYNEQFMKNWAFRRKVYSVARYLGLPQKPADFVSRAMVRLLCPKLPAHLSKDPLAESVRVLEKKPALANV
jgi:hypothetical protein